MNFNSAFVLLNALSAVSGFTAVSSRAAAAAVLGPRSSSR